VVEAGGCGKLLGVFSMDDSNIRQATLKQYRAGLKMLGQAMELCPDDLWFSNDYRNRFWHIAYHAMFYTHFYLQPSEHDFQPWTKHVSNSNYLGPRPWAKDEPFQLPQPYTKAELDEYLKLCYSQAERQVPLLRFEDASGFSWLPFNKLELQFYNIRHLQHHTGQLIERLRTAADISVSWVISG
jgi:DinB superfamily